jgi:hypothetical protein
MIIDQNESVSVSSLFSPYFSLDFLAIEHGFLGVSRRNKTGGNGKRHRETAGDEQGCIETQPANKSSPKSENKPKTQSTKIWNPLSLQSISLYCFEHFWTYLDFFRLYSTQPANETNPKQEKQLKT